MLPPNGEVKAYSADTVPSFDRVLYTWRTDAVDWMAETSGNPSSTSRPTDIVVDERASMDRWRDDGFSRAQTPTSTCLKSDTRFAAPAYARGPEIKHWFRVIGLSAGPKHESGCVFQIVRQCYWLRQRADT